MLWLNEVQPSICGILQRNISQYEHNDIAFERSNHQNRIIVFLQLEWVWYLQCERKHNDFPLTSFRGLRSEICDQYPGQGPAELQELSLCSLSQHRKGKVSYCDLYPVIVLTHSQVIYMWARLLRGSTTVRCVQHRRSISAEPWEHRLMEKNLESKEKTITDKLCSTG